MRFGNRAALAWFTGIWEGEGSLYRDSRVNKNGTLYTNWRLQVTSTDYDMLSAVREIAGCGTINEHKMREAARNRKRIWTWSTGSKTETYAVCVALLCLARTARRRDQLINAICDMTTPQTCRRGHARTPENWQRRSNGTRYCKLCRNERRRVT